MNQCSSMQCNILPKGLYGYESNNSRTVHDPILTPETLPLICNFQILIKALMLTMVRYLVCVLCVK